jgi:putative DNA modification/repair radical SAM protein
MFHITDIKKVDIQKKLEILSAAAKYDVACTSSGSNRGGKKGMTGNTHISGICHSFSGDGRCISLLKILLSNDCIYDCVYCMNRRSNDVERAAFTPEEVCRLTMGFYRRNYIEGLFLSSAVIRNPDDTMELLYQTVRKLREEYKFNGYIHVKAIPGASPDLIEKVGFLVDRMSANLELPTAEGLRNLAPSKTREGILQPMRQIQEGIRHNKHELAVYRHASSFVPAGQSTQMIIGATPDTDYEIMKVSQTLYDEFSLKRVFYSAYVAVNEDKKLPALGMQTPLLREHRLYQADWLLRFYGFRVEELLSEKMPNFNVLFDPKCNWALNHLEEFPVEVNRASYYMLLRVPGIGTVSARRIINARRFQNLNFDDLKKLGVVLKRAVYFIVCSGKRMYPFAMNEDFICRSLLDGGEKLPEHIREAGVNYRQLSLFDDFHMDFSVPGDEKRWNQFGQI